MSPGRPGHVPAGCTGEPPGVLRCALGCYLALQVAWLNISRLLSEKISHRLVLVRVSLCLYRSDDRWLRIATWLPPPAPMVKSRIKGLGGCPPMPRPGLGTPGAPREHPGASPFLVWLQGRFPTSGFMFNGGCRVDFPHPGSCFMRVIPNVAIFGRVGSPHSGLYCRYPHLRVRI